MGISRVIGVTWGVGVRKGSDMQMRELGCRWDSLSV